jgi:hypothetical protein
MEQDLNDNNDYYENNDFFKLEYANQDVSNREEFRNWYNNAKEYVKKINLKRSKDYIENINNPIFRSEISILTIEFCENCLSYTICSLRKGFSNAICNKCKECLCIGCSRKMPKINNVRYENTLCLKGYLKSLYLRVINRRSILRRTNACIHIMHIIFCLLMTPFYLGFISNFIGFLVHKNKKRNFENFNEHQIRSYFLYSILRGLLMFPYIILFFPFMVILLLPGIFSYKYYLYVLVLYITAIWSGNEALTNVGNN